jgi:hypothetical protein
MGWDGFAGLREDTPLPLYAIGGLGRDDARRTRAGRAGHRRDPRPVGRAEDDGRALNLNPHGHGRAAWQAGLHVRDR